MTGRLRRVSRIDELSLHRAQELLLRRLAGEVLQRVGVALPHEFQRQGAVHVVPASLEVERRVSVPLHRGIGRIPNGLFDVDVHAAHGVDDLLESLKIKDCVIADGHVDDAFDGLDKKLGATVGIGIVNAIIAETRNVDPQALGIESMRIDPARMETTIRESVWGSLVWPGRRSSPTTTKLTGSVPFQGMAPA